jgi:hypothetical protein
LQVKLLLVQESLVKQVIGFKVAIQIFVLLELATASLLQFIMALFTLPSVFIVLAIILDFHLHEALAIFTVG